jgi:hypothetical protein
MSLTPSVAEILQDHVTLEIECIDRMYLNVFVPQLQYSRGIANFFRFHRGQPVPSSALMAPMTKAFVESVEAFVASTGVPLITFGKGERKDDVMLKYLARFTGTEGVLFVGKAQEKAGVFRTEGRHDSRGKRYPQLVRSTAMVNQYYFYCVDEDFGPLFLKVCSYFPYTAKMCINGNEYLKRQLQKRSIPFKELDNGILSCAEPSRAQAIAEGLNPKKIDALLRKWLKRLPHPFTPADRQAGYRYQISILQVELSLTQVFDRPVMGRLFFEQVIRENLDLGRPDEVQLIFDRRITRSTPGRFRTRVITQGVTPCLHVDYKHSRIKQYFKEGRALRTETTINDTRDFRISRGLKNLPVLRAIGLTANRRLLNVERTSYDCMIGEDALLKIAQPAVVEGQRVSALRLLDPVVQALLSVLVLFRLMPMGFSNKELRERLAPLLGLDPSTLTQGKMTYQLRRLRLRGFIERIEETHRYQVTSMGLRTALFLTRLHSRLLRPGLSCILASYPQRDQLRSSFDSLERTMEAWIQDAHLGKELDSAATKPGDQAA